jgi:hypothetical protein
VPAIAEAAHDGALSWDQLRGAVEVATPTTDAEWARRAPNTTPADLQRQARAAKTVTPEDAAARREARQLRCWTEPEAGMVAGRFRLPDVDGVVIDHGPGRIAIPAHRMEPHGTERLVGDPDHPDGLWLMRLGADARAGPDP